MVVKQCWGCCQAAPQDLCPQQGIINILLVLRVGSAPAEMGTQGCKVISVGLLWVPLEQKLILHGQRNILLMGSLCCLREKPNHLLDHGGKTKRAAMNEEMVAELLFGTGLSCGEQSQSPEGSQPREVFMSQPAALARAGCCHQSNKTRDKGGGRGAGMLVCLLGIEEGMAGCLFTAQRVQQLFPNKKSHPRNKLSARLPHGGMARRRSRDFRKTPRSWELVTSAAR